MQQIQLQKQTCCTNEPTERKTPSRALVILSPQVQSAERVALHAEWSSPACTNSNTVGRNQSLACLDPPSPESLRNCGARSDKPLICWLRECRQAMLRWWQPVCWGGGGLCWLNTSLPGSHVNFSVSRPLSHGRPLNRKCCSLQGPKRGLRLPVHMTLCMLAVALAWRGRHVHYTPRERSVSFQIRGQDCFYSPPLVWPHSQEQLHFREPTPPCSPLTARLDRVVCVSVCAHACGQLCALVCVSERAWILLQFDPTQIFLKEKQRRGGQLWSQCTRPTEPLHRSQWNLYL